MHRRGSRASNTRESTTRCSRAGERCLVNRSHRGGISATSHRNLLIKQSQRKIRLFYAKDTICAGHASLANEVNKTRGSHYSIAKCALARRMSASRFGKDGDVRLVATLERPLNGATCTVSLSSHFNYTAFLFSLEAINCRTCSADTKGKPRSARAFPFTERERPRARHPSAHRNQRRERSSFARAVNLAQQAALYSHLAWTTLTGNRNART